MIEKASQKIIKTICLGLLTRREHSQLELLNKLVIKGFRQNETQLIIDALAEQGWQSDQRFAESYARYRIRKGNGPIKINYELQQRGIKGFELNTVLIDLEQEWIEVLESVYDKKYSENKFLSKKEWLKRCRFLQQRGFNIEMINKMFQRLKIQITYY